MGGFAGSVLGLGSAGASAWSAKKVIEKIVTRVTTPEARRDVQPPELDARAQAERDEAARKERERRLLGGRASTILTGGRGDLTTPTLGSAILLGQ